MEFRFGHRRAVAPTTLVALVALASCLQGAKAPVVTPQRTLELGTEGAGTASTAPFAVVFASPRGPTVDPSEVTLVWNRPMRPLDLAGDEAAPPAKIVGKGASAPPKGAWRWMGTQALVFAPDPALPRATEYDVTVPAGTRALDGSVLSAPFAFSFATARPSLERTEPSEGASHLTPSATFELRFDQGVEPREVERAVKLRTAGEGAPRAIAFRASRPKADAAGTVKLVPTTPLPLGKKIELVLDASLRGVEGPLPTGTDKRLTFETYGALAVRRVDCYRSTPHGKCAAGDPVRLELSNRVAFGDLRAHVRIEPPVPMVWPTSRDPKDKLQYVSLPAKLAPGKSYRVVVTAGLKDEHGQTLARDAAMPLDIDDLWPTATIGVEGTAFEADAAPASMRAKGRSIPITSVNVPSYELVAAALDERALADLVLSSEGPTSAAAYDAARRVRGARIEKVAPTAATNVDAIRRVNLDELLAAATGKAPTGAAFLGIRYAGARGAPVVIGRIVNVSDLAISAKLSRFGSLVWVTHLGSGRAAAGATVAVRARTRGEVFTTVTDAAGVATIPASAYSPVRSDGSADTDALLVARAAAGEAPDWTYQPIDEGLGSWRYGVGADLTGRLDTTGILFTDRGVYRPGETLRLKGIFRQPLARGTETPAGREVRLIAYDGSGDKIFDATSRLDAFGEMASDIVVPATAHLGQAEVRAELISGASASATDSTPDRWSPAAASTSVLLAAYKAAEIKVGVEADRPAFVRGDRATFVTRGDYLYGAPMSGGRVRTTVTRGPGHFVPPGAEGLVIDDDTYARDLDDASTRAGLLQSIDGALDAKGALSGALALPMPGQRGTELLTIESEVEDVTRQTVSGRTSVVVHPGDVYVAMRPPRELFVARGTKLRPELTAIEPGGKTRAGVALKVELVRRTWHTVVEADGENGRHYASKAVDVVASGCALVSAPQPVACDLAVPDAGYFILRALAKDARGNAVASSTPLYALGDGEDASWAVSDATKIELVTDKKTYEVGDTAKVLVKSPFRAAEALITIERAGVYRHERRELTGATPTLAIPITDDMRPNAFVSVHLVRGRTADAPAKGADVGAPAFRLGYASLVVNPEARRLRVAVTPSVKDARPGQTIDVDLAVADRAGKPVKSEVTFYVVDEGVLALTDYATPDPIPVFTAQRPLAVFALETRNDLARIVLRHLGESGVDKGDEGGGGGVARADFRATAHFEPGVVTGADGKAKTRFKLPDNLTTFRLMAVAAAEDDRFGSGDAQVVSSRRLMLRPALPRFVRAGDAIDAGVVVSTKGMPATTVDVRLATTGLTSPRDVAVRKVHVPANGSVEVRWPITAPVAGKATMSFRARADGGEEDAVEVSREVAVPTSLEAVALAGETSGAVGERLGDLRAMRGDVGGLDVKLASTALVGIGSGVEQLLEYPYGCTEQLTSRLLPMIPLRKLATEFNVVLPKDVAPIVGETLGRILKAQRDDGGFGYWNDSRMADAWLTAYVLFALDAAKKHGYAVPDTSIAGATHYVRRFLETDSPTLAPHALATRALVVDILASVGSPDAGYTSRLLEARSKLPLFARALLAHALAIGKMDLPARGELLRDLEAHLRVTPTGATVVDDAGQANAYASILDSDGRTTALVLRALVAADPQSPLAARLARGLLAARQGGKWRSTQEAAWALLALEDYRKAREAAPPSFDAHLFLGNDELLTAPFHERSTREVAARFGAAKLVSAGASGQTLAFRVDGKGTLFYEARLRYARTELPSTGLDRGFFVKKLVRAVKPDQLREALRVLPERSAVQASGGDLVLVDLLVVTPTPREHVVVDDPLPAGLEPVDTSFATTSRALDVGRGNEGEGDDGDDGSSEVDGDPSRPYAWYHRELHDDRVLTFVEHMPAGSYHYRYLARATTFGRYVVPPTRVECMYEPEIFGRTAATAFEVKASP